MSSVASWDATQGPTPEGRFSISTADDMPPAQREALWEFNMCRAFNLGVVPDKESVLSAQADVLPIGHCRLSRLNTSPARYCLEADGLPTAWAGLNIIQLRSGRAHCKQRGREVTIGPGQALAVLVNEPYSVDLLDNAVANCLSVPLSPIAALVPNLSEMLVRPLDENRHAIDLLEAYGAQLMQIDGTLDKTFANTISNHLMDLVANALSSPVEVMEDMSRRSIRIARKRSIKNEIVTHYMHHDLSSDMVAQRLGITPRYLRKILKDDGTSFTDILRQVRLQKAHQLLSDPQMGKLSITKIAYQVGFNDLSYFNRSFRQHHGLSPSDVRAESLSRRAA